MFATIARATRAVDAPNTLAWQAVGAAWTIWLLGWAMPVGGWYWGGLLVTGGLWVTTAACDRLERYGALPADAASLMRAGALGLGLVWAPRAVAVPFDDLRLWLGVVVAAAAAHLLAPWAVQRGGRFELWRWVDDMKAAAGFAGMAVGVPVVVIALGAQVGWSLSPAMFTELLAGAAFCVVPTVLTLRAS